jgi:HD-GYP domain-containing protein (c-di-GMP phosphodiesterase class II)
MCSDRPHRISRTTPQAVDELRRAAGSQLHPQVVEALLSVLSRSEELAGATP